MQTEIQAPPQSEVLRRGRFHLASALVLLAAMLISSVVESSTRGEDRQWEAALSIAIYVLVLHRAFTGGPTSLGLIKGCLGIFGIVILPLLLFVLFVLILASPPDSDGALLDRLSVIPVIASTLYVYWVMFLSKSVKTYIMYRQKYKHLNFNEK